MNMPHTSVVVLGAGFSGLAAALRLRDHGIDAVVVEARDRVAGRTHTKHIEPTLQIDLGGQWFGPTQDRMYELVDQYGLELFPLQEQGEAVYHVSDQRHSALPESVEALYADVDTLALDVDLTAVENTPDAAELDRMTFHTWLHQHADRDAAEFVGRTLAGGLLGKDAGDISVLQMLFYIRSGGGVESLTSTQGGAQQDRVIGGPPALAQRMAAGLGAERIVFEFCTVGLQREGDTWRIRSADGRELTADQVISTLPPTALAAVDISPALPSPKRRALRSLMPGHSLKFHAVYPAPLWHDQGLSGVFNSQDGWITEAVDNSVPGDARGVLTFFVYGEQAAQLTQLPAQERPGILLEEVAERLNDQRLRGPTEFIEFSWEDEPFTGGCFSSSFTVGNMHRYGSILKQPWDGLHFAGTETSEIWNGYIEGAVRAGEREADRIAAG